MQIHRKFSRKLALSIKKGAVGILPTDTIYGIVGSAFSFGAARRIDKLRNRDLTKPFIVLISSVRDLGFFGIKLDKKMKDILKKVWPGKVSILLPAPDRRFSYLHRGTERIAFRVPDRKNIRDFLKTSGPIVAPSANWEGKPPATDIRSARRYFGNRVDFYIDKGDLKSLPSTLVSLEGSKLRILRPGAAKIAKSLIL